MEHKLIVELNEQYNFYKVTCPEGCHITDYTEDKDIRDLIISTELYIPGTYTVDEIAEKYYCVTEDEYNELIAKRDKAIKEFEKEMDNQNNVEESNKEENYGN